MRPVQDWKKGSAVACAVDSTAKATPGADPANREIYWIRLFGPATKTARIAPHKTKKTVLGVRFRLFAIQRRAFVGS